MVRQIFTALKPPQNIAHFVSLDDGKLWISLEYVDIFQKMGLTTFRDVMHYQKECALYKKNRFREVLRVTLPTGKALFLKRHFSPDVRSAFRAWMRFSLPKSSSRQEIESAGILNSLKIGTMKPVAFGEEHGKLFEPPSFIMTEEVEGVKLEKYLANTPNRFQEDISFRKSLIAELASIARAMHSHGVHHRDFYLGHLLISWPSPDRFQITVIDLQRVRRRKHLHDRWKIKDLAQIGYSALQIAKKNPGVITNTDRVRFFHEYSGRAQFTPQDILWINKILRRHKRMQRHDKSSRVSKEGGRFIT